MRRDARKAGFTLIEAIVAITLMAIVLVKLILVVKEASKVHRNESLAMSLEDQAAQVLDRIAFAVVGSDAESLTPGVGSPFFTEELQFQVSMGVEDGETVWSDPEMVGQRQSQVYWGRNVGEINEQLVVWCNTVSDLLENEVSNGDDDNDNGLADEFGLTFVLDGRSVTIRLTLERVQRNGEVLQVSSETVVTCRN